MQADNEKIIVVMFLCKIQKKLPLHNQNEIFVVQAKN